MIISAGIDKGKLTSNEVMFIKTNGGIFDRNKPSFKIPFHISIFDL